MRRLRRHPARQQQKGRSMSRTTEPTGPLNTVALAEHVAAELGVPHAEGQRAVHAVLDVITRTVAAGHPVRVTNFGGWTPVWTDERQARDPQTGAPVTVPAGMRPRFTPYARFRELVRNGDVAGARIRKLPKTARARTGRAA